jgi:L-asparagine transporter-like permease
METFAIITVAVIATFFVFGAYKMFMFFKNDNSYNRYEYKIVDVDGNLVEKVIDTHDPEYKDN